MNSNYQIAVLSLGGETGGDRLTSADGLVNGIWHSIVHTEDVVYTTLVGVDGDGLDVNMITVNGLDSLTAKSEICAPDLNKGGYIKQIQISGGEIIRRKKTNTERKGFKLTVDSEKITVDSTTITADRI